MPPSPASSLRPTPTGAPTSPRASTSGKPRSAMVYGPRTSAVTSDDPLTPTDWPPPCPPPSMGGLLLTQVHRDTAPSKPHSTRCPNTSRRSRSADVRLRHNCFSDRGRALPPSGPWPGRGDLLRRSLHGSSLRLVPKAANAPQGRTAQLVCGAIAGPLFASAFTAIGAARAGYDWERLPVSSLAIGRHGWLQRMNFVVAGVLYSCAGAGLRRSANRRAGPRAVPALVAGVGVGLIGSGVFVTDPVGGFPPRITGRGGPGRCRLGHNCADPGRAAAQPFRHPGLHRHPRRRHGQRGHRRTGPGLPLGWLLGGVRPRHGREFRYVRHRLR